MRAAAPRLTAPMMKWRGSSSRSCPPMMRRAPPSMPRKPNSAPPSSRPLRRLLLQVIDTFWLEHLETMDYLRRSVSLRAYGQRDPLIEYRREGLQRFRQLEADIAAKVAAALPRLVNADEARSSRKRSGCARGSRRRHRHLRRAGAHRPHHHPRQERHGHHQEGQRNADA